MTESGTAPAPGPYDGDSFRGRHMSALPAWAQAWITGLQSQARNSDERITRLTAGPGDSNTFADPYSDLDHALGTDPMIRFGGREFDRTFDVQRLADDRLQVTVNARNMTGEEVVIIPQSSNNFIVGIITRPR